MKVAENLTEAVKSLGQVLDSKEAYEAYYTPRESPIDEVKSRIKHADSSIKLLFTGHRAVGKTTELHRLSFELKDMNFRPIFLSLGNELKTYDVQYTDIPIMIFLKLVSDTEELLDDDLVKEVLKLTDQISGESMMSVIKEKRKGLGIRASLKISIIELFGSYTREETVRTEVRKKTIGLIRDLICITQSSGRFN